MTSTGVSPLRRSQSGLWELWGALRDRLAVMRAPQATWLISGSFAPLQELGGPGEASHTGLAEHPLLPMPGEP